MDWGWSNIIESTRTLLRLNNYVAKIISSCLAKVNSLVPQFIGHLNHRTPSTNTLIKNQNFKFHWTLAIIKTQLNYLRHSSLSKAHPFTNFKIIYLQLVHYINNPKISIPLSYRQLVFWFSKQLKHTDIYMECSIIPIKN